MEYKKLFYPESRFGGFTDIDGTVNFYTRINSLLSPSSIVLDVGCGRGSYQTDPVSIRRALRILKGKCKRVLGVDVDDRAKENPFLDEFHLIHPDSPWPIRDQSIDVCVCDFVIEHIKDPDQLFAEFGRVIKKGGYLCVRTPNLFSYFGLISKVVPNKFHFSVLSKAQKGLRDEDDTFPTFYNCNITWKLKRMMTKYGFAGCVYGYEAEPNYLSFSGVSYCLGVLHQKLAPGAIKINLFGFAEKK